MGTEPALIQRENQISHTATSVTVGWRNRQPLTGADLTDFLALRRGTKHLDVRKPHRADVLFSGLVRSAT